MTNSIATGIVQTPAHHARFTTLFGAIFGVVLAGITGVNFIFDPLMMFHYPWAGSFYSTNERFRVPGFARSLDYDTAIIVASTAMAIRPSDVRLILRSAPVVQVIGGATISEVAMAVVVTAKQKKLKQIIWLVDPIIFNFSERHADVPLPEYLYQGGG